MKYVKCSILDRDKERVFSRVATRGVVKFFNVLNQQKSELKTQIKNAGPYERKIDKVYNSIDKKSFLDRLKETNNQNGDDDDDDLDANEAKRTNGSKVGNGAKPTWSVLHDDFSMGGEMKDWEKDDDDDDSNDSDESGSGGDEKKQQAKPVANKNKKQNNKGKQKKKLKK